MPTIKRTPLSLAVPATATTPELPAGILRVLLNDILAELQKIGTGGAMPAQPHDFWGMHTIDGVALTLALLKEKLNLTWDTIVGRPSVFPAAPHSLWGSAHKELDLDGTLSTAVTPESLLYKLIKELNDNPSVFADLTVALNINQPKDPFVSGFANVGTLGIRNWPGATLSDVTVNFQEPFLSVKGIIHSNGNSPTGTVDMDFPLTFYGVPDLFISTVVPKQVIGFGTMTSALNTSTAAGIPCFVVALGTSHLNSDRSIQFRYSTSPSAAQDINSSYTPVASFWTQAYATLAFYFQCPAYKGM